MMNYLWAKQVRLTEFGRHVRWVSERVKQTCKAKAEALGRPVRLDGEVPKSFRGEVVSDLKWREEGVRIKHRVNGNSVKLYDKAFTGVGSVLRAETTIQQAGEFRVYRRKEGDARGKKSWRPLRGGVADLHRRAEISRRAAERYLDALAGVDEQTTLEELIQRLGRPRQWKG